MHYYVVPRLVACLNGVDIVCKHGNNVIYGSYSLNVGNTWNVHIPFTSAIGNTIKTLILLAI